MVPSSQGLSQAWLREAQSTDPSKLVDASGVMNAITQDLTGQIRNIKQNKLNSGNWGFNDAELYVEINPMNRLGRYQVTYNNEEGRPVQKSFHTYAEMQNWYLGTIEAIQNTESSGDPNIKVEESTKNSQGNGTTTQNGNVTTGTSNGVTKKVIVNDAYKAKGAKEATGKGLDKIDYYSNILVDSQVHIPHISSYIKNALINLDNANAPTMTITGAYRTQAYNDSLPNSVNNSKHVHGNAIDIRSSKQSVAWFKSSAGREYLKNNGMQAFVHGNHIHMEYDPENPGWIRV